MAHRNKFEDKVAAQLGPEFAYEAKRLPYNLTHHYLPDWIDAAQKRIIEAKGRFTAADRKKHKALKQQYPDWSITIVFQDPTRKISKASSTSYSDWCMKHGIAWRKA